MLFAPFLFCLCPQLVSLVTVSHRAAQHFFAIRAQRLQWSLIAAPSKVGISTSSPLKFIHLSVSLLWAPLQCLQAGWCSAQTSEQCKQLYLSSTGWLFFFFFWMTSSCLVWTSCLVTETLSDPLWDAEPSVCFHDSISFSKVTLGHPLIQAKLDAH